MLTAAGQTYDLKIELPPGTYTFQCDPHIEMAMVGTLVVE
jgi:plastocyanin